MNLKTKKYWHDFCQKHNLDLKTSVDTFAFGATDQQANELADLVNKGIKTATTSAYEEPLPKVGEYSIVLNAKAQPVCVIKTLEVKVIPYDQITAHHAYLEGEGDRTYQYWRKVHDEFFKNELGEKFTPKSLMVCEIFEKVSF